MSLLTLPGRDIIVVNEDDYEEGISFEYKIHLIRLAFDNPTDAKMEWVTDTFSSTNRYVVDIRNIRYYNYYLKRTNFKYYIINTTESWRGLVSFFKRNNKVLLDITKLPEFEKQFVLNVALEDILSNLEVILIDEDDYNTFEPTFQKWKGDVIIRSDEYTI